MAGGAASVATDNCSDGFGNDSEMAANEACGVDGVSTMAKWKAMTTQALPERAVHVGVQSRILLDHSGALNREHGDFNIPGRHAC